MIFVYIAIILTASTTTHQVQSHPALHGMLQTELSFREHASSHAELLASTITKIERKVSRLILSKLSYMDKPDYVGTPLTALVMVRRLVQDWPLVATSVGRLATLNNLKLDTMRWPTIDDLEEAARAMMRSQMTSDPSTALLVRGFQSNTIVTNVTAADCLEIARQYMKKDHFTEAKELLQFALAEIKDSENASLQETVLYYLAAALCFSDGKMSSINILRGILKENPRSKPPKELAGHYKIMSYNGCLDGQGEIYLHLDRVHQDAGADLAVVYHHRNNTANENHNRLCRGEGKINSTLRCHYVDHQQPHLRFQPFKVEELQLDPPVLRFHDLISDNEAEGLKTQAKEVMGPAFVGTKVNRRTSEYRTSQVAWLYTGRDWLDRRISEATRLDTHFAEIHQVSRYSVAGEYLPHTDHFGTLTDDWGGDRIATVMFYLNDVELGGNTIFTRWQLSVPPVKNSAVLWFNYFPSGEGDASSEHSGCPVLKGTKWVLNKWIHNGGNHVNFPCALDRPGTFKEFYL